MSLPWNALMLKVYLPTRSYAKSHRPRGNGLFPRENIPGMIEERRKTIGETVLRRYRELKRYRGN